MIPPMHSHLGNPSPPGPEIVLLDLNAQLLSAPAKASPGAVLVALVHLQLRGVALDQATCSALAAWLGVDAVHVAATAEWLDQLVNRARSGEVHTECHGTNCALNGSEQMSAAMTLLLQHHGIQSRPVKVHCLNQCDHGATLRSGEVFFLASEQQCRVDERPWRDASGERPWRDASGERPWRDAGDKRPWRDAGDERPLSGA